MVYDGLCSLLVKKVSAVHAKQSHSLLYLSRNALILPYELRTYTNRLALPHKFQLQSINTINGCNGRKT